MIKTVFFDLGWTLVKPAGAGWLYNPLFFRLLPEITPERIREKDWLDAARKAYIPLAENPYMKDCEEQTRRFQAYYETLLREAGVTFAPEIPALLSEDLSYNTENMSLLDGAAETLSLLHHMGIRMAVISDTWPYIEQILRDLGIEHYFDHFTYSYRLGTQKPSPMMFQDALDHCGCLPRECLFIDDIGTNLEAAERFRINAVQSLADPAGIPDTRFAGIRHLKELPGIL